MTQPTEQMRTEVIAHSHTQYETIKNWRGIEKPRIWKLMFTYREQIYHLAYINNIDFDKATDEVLFDLLAKNIKRPTKN